MTSTVHPAELDEIAALLVAGREYRDAWLPLRGTLSSGFSNPEGSVEFVDVGAPILDQEARDAARQEIKRLLSDPTVRVIPASSADYPSRLRNLDGRPALLFVQGDPIEPSMSPLAIVGSRNASDDGLRAAQQVARCAAAAGHVIVAGLAAGIDSAGHQGALDGGGRTIAVMGTGLGKVFPSQHRALAKRIARQGALVTQFPPRYPPSKTTFPARNALIAGLSDVSLLIELKEHSGTRIEADCALAQGKRVLLWAPTLETHAWAQRFAENPQVAFVGNPDEVLAELSDLK